MKNENEKETEYVLINCGVYAFTCKHRQLRTVTL